MHLRGVYMLMHLQKGYTHKCVADLMVYMLIVLMHTRKDYTHNTSVDFVVISLTVAVHC